MLIERLSFFNFLVFNGKQELDFSFREGRNVTVVLAPNNSGKTSIIRGIEFLLYGASDQPTKSKFPNLACIASLGRGKTAKCYVEARIRTGLMLLLSDGTLTSPGRPSAI